MCGITGFYGFEDEALLKKMTSLLEHRGPDDEGFYTDKNIALGQRRLSIIDLSTGKQPIFNEDESIVVVYNGEIYNFQEIKSELEKKGHKFSTATDTEVIVHAYEEYGTNSFEMFNGMFAFAMWDSNKKKLFLVRDRFGIKPLFYYHDKEENNLIFASEIKSILEYPGYNQQINKEAMHYYINLRYVPENITMFNDIFKLMPAHYLVFSDKDFEIKRYWQLDVNSIDESKSEEYYAKKTLELFEESVKRQLISDVPVSAFLSGGLDTSSIVAFASKHYEGKLKTFCMGFGEENDEFEDAKIIADKFDTDHKDYVVKFNLVKDLPKLIKFSDQPKRNLYPYFIYEQVKKEAKVVLSGLGGDELFAGYLFRYNYVNDNYKPDASINANEINTKIKQQIDSGILEKDFEIQALQTQKYAKEPHKLYTTVNSLDEVWEKDYLKNKIYGDKLLSEANKDVSKVFKPYFITNNQVQNVLNCEFNEKMVNDFLFIDDSMSMANSVEARVPFLDNHLTELAFKIPTRMKLDPNNRIIGKKIFRNAMKTILPKEVFEKKKQGFASHTLSTYENELKEIAQEKLSNGFLVKNNFIQKKYVDSILSHKTQKEMMIHYNNLWNLTAAEMWHEIYFNN
jgi:asparagine synthase (glutamine-hydrolysing)